MIRCRTNIVRYLVNVADFDLLQTVFCSLREKDREREKWKQRAQGYETLKYIFLYDIAFTSYICILYANRDDGTRLYICHHENCCHSFTSAVTNCQSRFSIKMICSSPFYLFYFGQP